MILSHAKIEEIAAAVIKDFNLFFFGEKASEARSMPQGTPIDQFASEYLRLKISFEKLSVDGSLCGLTAYEDTEYAIEENGVKEIDREIAELSDKNILITRLHSKGIIRSFEYSEQISAVNSKITALRKERTRLFEERDENGTLSGLKTLNNRLTDLKKPLTEFDSELFAETVKGITVPNNGEVRIEFAGGLTVSEKIPDRRRCREK